MISKYQFESKDYKAFPPYILIKENQIYPKLPSEEDCIIYLQTDEKYRKKND